MDEELEEKEGAGGQKGPGEPTSPETDSEAPTLEEEGSPQVATKEEDRGWEETLETYPLREAGEDPRWAVRIVWIWVGFALLSLAFILTLLILSAMTD